MLKIHDICAGLFTFFMIKETTLAHLGLFTSGLLFGASYWIAKGLMPDFMQPMQIIFCRGLVALTLFWLVSLFQKPTIIQPKDHAMLAICGLLGITINQAFFFWGLSYTSPVDTSLIHSASPAMVMLFSAIIAKERPGISGIGGIALGALGSVILIYQGKNATGGNNHLLGNSLIFINIMAYSLYLVLVKPLMTRYNAVAVMKWSFAYGFLFMLPFCYKSAYTIQWAQLTANAWFAITYIVIGTTFIAYLLTTFSLKSLSAGVAGYYIYMQPVIAAAMGILIYGETISASKILAAILVFAGIFMINKRLSLKQMSERNKQPSK